MQRIPRAPSKALIRLSTKNIIHKPYFPLTRSLHSVPLHSVPLHVPLHTPLHASLHHPPHGVYFYILPNSYMFIQKRYFMRPFFRIFRSSFAIASGAAAGTAAFANYKFQEASNKFGSRLDKASDWVKSIFDFSSENSLFDEVITNQSKNTTDNANTESQTHSNESTGNQSDPNSNTQSQFEDQPDTLTNLNKAIGSNDNDNDDNEDHMINLTKSMIEIRSILTKVEGSSNVQIPSIVVIGSQSSGKSSVLEAIVGHEFLPKGSNMVTRRPIELTLIHTEQGEKEYCEFPYLKTGKLGFKDVKQVLVDLNKAVPASMVIDDDPIQLSIYSPNVPDLNLIDLPGYIQVVAADQPLELKQRIQSLCERYIQEPNVILAVSAADVDLANSTALRASRKADPFGERTIGVISKMDLVDAERGCETLLTRDYPLKMGYVGVVTKTPHRSIFKSDENMTISVSKAENAFFADPMYKSVDWGVLNLRSKLVKVLSKNMIASLEPTIKNLQTELEDVSYRFKVQYNDRVLTPETYLAQCSDEFKVGFQEMNKQFGREQVHMLIKQLLDQLTLDVVSENYWNDIETNTPKVERYDDILNLQMKLDSATSNLTKSGVGRKATQALIRAIEDNMEKLKRESCFKNHPLALKLIDDATNKILKTKFASTSDQIENSIKPYKYEVDIDAREWQQSREYAYALLKEELNQCNDAYNTLKTDIGAKKLTTLLKSLKTLPANDLLDQNSSKLVQRVLYAAFLRDRATLLKARSTFIKSSKCKTWKDKSYCPEVFMDVVSTKLASTAVLFLNFELLSDFYYSFPREFDSNMRNLSQEEIESLASQDPKIKRHVELQSRKELLHLALTKLRAINDIQRMDRS